MSVTFSSSTGVESPFAVTAMRSGTPFDAAHASWASPKRPPFSFGATETVYAPWFATTPGSASETFACCSSCAIAFEISSRVGAACVPLPWVAAAGSATSYAVFEDES